MKKRFTHSQISQIFVYSCTVIILLLLFITWYKVQFNTPDVWTILNEAELPQQFPLSAESREQLMENSDLHFKYHNSLTTELSLLIAGMGILLTFAAFYIQYLFNMRQKADLSRERFENQYFHLLDVSRGICQNIYIQNVGKGKNAFHYMFYEYKAIYFMVLKDKIIKDLSPESINRFAFKIFLNGVSQGFLPEVGDDIVDQTKLKQFVDTLLEKQKDSEEHGEAGRVDKGVKYLMDYRCRRIKYFDGHRMRLVHYFNYIMLILNHIEANSDEDEDLDTMSYLCGELTEHETGLLYAFVMYRKSNGCDKYCNLVEMLLEKSETAHKFKFDSRDFITRLA